MSGTAYDVLFYALAWCIAATCGLLVTHISRGYRDFWDLVAVSAISGFTAVALVGLVVRVSGGTSGNEPYYLGLAIIIGFLGKRGLKLTDLLVQLILKKYGINFDGDGQESDKSEDHNIGDHHGGDGVDNGDGAGLH